MRSFTTWRAPIVTLPNIVPRVRRVRSVENFGFKVLLLASSAAVHSVRSSTRLVSDEVLAGRLLLIVADSDP